MARIPQQITLTNSSVDVLNVIRANASQNYRDYVPVATADAHAIREIGAIIMDYPALQNEFVSALINRIAKVVITSKTYDNPWSHFKKGVLEFGETIEEIFVELAKPHQYDSEYAATHIFQREIPDVHSAFHVMNYQKFYKVTIEENDLRKAFLSWDGVIDLITSLVERLVTSANYDEFLVMKYMLAKAIIRGQVSQYPIPAVTKANTPDIVTAIKSVSNDLTFMSGKYNLAGVRTKTEKKEQYVIVNSLFDATMDVNVLATAFNMDKAEFIGRRTLVDGFGVLDKERLTELFENDETYVEIPDEELALLNAIPAIVVDESWFQIFDNLLKMTEALNGEGLYTNHWLHVWKTFSISPFSNAVVFNPNVAGVESVTVSPTEATINKGGQVQLTATVDTTNFAPQSVNWSIVGDVAGVYVNGSGVVFSERTATTGEVTVRATSTFDNTIYGEATITIQ